MRSVFLTGSTGFVGKYVQTYFKNKYFFLKYEKETIINISQDIILHLAGKAHDLKNTSNIQEYYTVNTDFTKKLYNKFLDSDARVFINISSVKAVADELDCELTEDYIPKPTTHYGKSKLLAEEFILSKQIPNGKRVYILRPCMIHGHGNKGNLNLLFNIVSKGFPWPLGSFDNRRSFCSIDNLCFIINEIIENEKIPSGVYNVSDDEPLSTNKLIELISKSLNKKVIIWNIPQFVIIKIAIIGNLLKLPLNLERLQKLTNSYIVSNSKIKNAINKPLPYTSINGMKKTLESFNH
jgi:nucleoside-diphosphate-sugar epimerase